MPSGTPLGEMYIELGLDTSHFSTGLQSAKRGVNYFQAEIRGLDVVLKGNGKNSQALEAKYKSLGQVIQAQKKILSELKANFDTLDPGTAKWEKAAVEIERENVKLKAMEKQLDGVKSALQEVHSENSRWGKVSSTLTSWGDGFQKAGNKLRSMGDALKPVSTLLSGAFVLATKKAIDFEGQMNTTKSLLADTVGNASELNQVTGKLGEASKSWAKQYGISTSSINEGMQEIIKKGFDANQTIAAMPAILDASKASGDDFNVVMNASTNILRQFGLEAKDTSRVTDTLTYVANKTSAGFADMGSAMEYVGPVAKNVGMNLEETAAAVGILSDNGIAGEKAGTALRGALTRLLKPSKQNADAMEALGFSSEEFLSGAIKLPDVLDRIKKNTEGMTDAQKSALIAQAFGTEAQTAMNILVDQGGDKLRTLSKETKNATGYTKKLADELSKSSKNGVERFKSSLEVLQINIGQKLLPLFTPLLEKANQFIEWLDQAPPGVQKLVVAGGLALATGYPVLNLLGSLSTAGGGLLKVLGKIGGSIAAKTALSSVGEAAGVAAGSVGLLGNPVTWGILAGGGALLGLGILVNHLEEAHQRTQTWGAEVSKVQAQELQAFKDKVDETNRSMTEFGSGAVKDIGSVKQAFKELVDEINGLTDEKLAKDLDVAKSLGLSDEVVNALKKNADESKAYVQRTSDDVIAIYQRHANDRTKLTAEEQSIVLEKQTELVNKQLQLMEFSGEERVAIQKAINGQIDELNAEQVRKVVATTKTWLDDEEKSYKEHKEKLLALRREIKGDSEEEVAARAEINRQLETLESDHLAAMDGYRQKYVVALRAHYDKQKELFAGNAEMLEAVEQGTKIAVEEMGLSWEEFLKTSTASVEKVTGDYQLLGQTVQGMSDRAVEANDKWKSLIWDEKSAKLKTNAIEELKKAAQSEEGWNNLQFILKNATIDSNAREMIVEAMEQAGLWDALGLKEKQLIVSGNQAMTEIATNKELLAQWNALTPEQKQLLAINLTQQPTAEAQAAIDSVRQLTPSEIQAINKTSPEVAGAQAAIDSVFQRTPSTIEAKNATKPQVVAAQQAIDSVVQKYIPDISVRDSASPIAQDVLGWVNSIPEYKLITIEAVRRGEAGYYASGTNFHPGGLAVVNDQKGATYKELIHLPSGESFIPQGRDVLLDLPRGAKVFPARKTQRLMREMGIPKYAQGVGIPNDSRFIKEISQAQERTIVVSSKENGANGAILVILKEMLAVLKERDAQAFKDICVNLTFGNRTFSEIVEMITLEQEKRTRIQRKTSNM